MTQVRNHLRQEQRRQQDERTRIRITTSGSQQDDTFANTGPVLDGLPGHAAYQILRGVGFAGLQGFKRAGRRYIVGGEVYRLPTNSHAVSVAETLFRITEVGSAMLGSRSSDRSAFLPTGAALGLEAIDRFARWNRLQQVLFRASVGLLLNIQTAASADLDAAFAAFDRDINLRNLERRVLTYTGVEATRYQAALRGVSAGPGDNLAAELGRRIEKVVDMRNIRAEFATRQLAAEERRRREAAAERRRKQGQQQRGSDSGQGGFRVTSCEQIGERLARDLERLSNSNSMCTIYRGTANAYRQARDSLEATRCANSQELANLDQAIRQAEAGARSVCN